MSVRTCRTVLTALLLVCSAASAGVGLPKTDEYDSLPASFTGTSVLEYRMRRLVGESRLEDTVTCGYKSRGGGQFYEMLERGFSEWDVSGIPDTATIDSVFCVSNCFDISTEIRSLEFYEMTNQPSITMDPVALFDDAGDGDFYGAYPNPGIGWQVQRLSDAARLDLQSHLPFDWFAVGYTGIGSRANWSIRYRGFLESSAPRLVVYYTLGVPPMHDVGCNALIAPIGTVDSGTTVTPACSVYNYGTVAENYSVRMKVEDGYDQAVPVSGHLPGAAVYVTFPDWQAGSRGHYAVTCTTELASDINPPNDAQRGLLDVAVHDAAAVRIAVPADTISAGNIFPVAVFRNAGTLREPLTVYFSIADTLPLYAESIALVGGLPFIDTTLRFPVWGASEGSYTARCSVSMVGDQVPINDAAGRAFVVVPMLPFHDVGCMMVTAPSGQIDSGTTVTPACSVYNYGNQLEDYTVRMIIGGVYEQAAPVTGHEPGTALAVTFADWLPPGRGNYSVTCSTELASDSVSSNNTAYADANVMVHDAALTSIITPIDTILMGPVSPKVTARNKGTLREPVRAFFAIADTAEVYRDSLDLPGGLPYADTTLVFPAWNAFEGEYTARCSLFMAGDQIAVNDVIGVAFAVSGQLPGWHEKTPMPPGSKPIKDGGWLAYDASKTLVYASRGNKQPDFFAYAPKGDSWTLLEPWQPGAEGKPPSKGSAGCSDGNGTIYATKGNSTAGFYMYDAGIDAWVQLKDVPLGVSNKKVKGGTDIAWAYKGGVGSPYLLKGYKNEFYRYEVEGDSWTVLPPAPVGGNAKWDKGSWLAYDDVNNNIFAFKAKYMELYRYSPDGDSWSAALEPMPLDGIGGSKKAKDGGCGAFRGGSIFALKGGGTTQFFEYSIATNKWTERDTIPRGTDKKKVKAGADIVSTSTALYATKGNKTNELWVYAPGGFLYEAPRHDGVAASSSIVNRSSFIVSPNPLTGGLATVSFTRPLDHLTTGPLTLCIRDVTGRVVLKSPIANRHSPLALDLRSMPAGVYVLTVRGARNTVYATKLVVQR